MAKFKIFYSWQSDLAGNKTRNFIRGCIDEAIELAEESEAIEAQRDEATSGTTGSPNIVQTLFSKIDDSDLFVADISLCYSSDAAGRNKRSPNPNVLIELGYAVRVLGWDRVVCVCNIDFGDTEEMPFDIAQNRMLRYSIEGNGRETAKNSVTKAIFCNIRDLKKMPIRAKVGMAAHIVGAYDFATKRVIGQLVPFNIKHTELYTAQTDKLLEKAKTLLANIDQLTTKMTEAERLEQELQKAVEESEQRSGTSDALATLRVGILPTELEKMMYAQKGIFGQWKPAIIRDTKDIREMLSSMLDIEVGEDFFALGNLKISTTFSALGGTQFDGTDDEKAKHEKIHELSYTLGRVVLRKKYLLTFNNMVFIPLAIQNLSSIKDEDITVVVNIINGEIIEPSETLICDELDGLQGAICEDDMVNELFYLPEDGTIHIEETAYDPTDFAPKIPIYTGYGFSEPEKTAEDYLAELEDYIMPSTGDGYYEFDVTSLRPGECKWFTQGMLMAPSAEGITVEYHIHSAHSSGELSGKLSVRPELC